MTGPRPTTREEINARKLAELERDVWLPPNATREEIEKAIALVSRSNVREQLERRLACLGGARWNQNECPAQPGGTGGKEE